MGKNQSKELFWLKIGVGLITLLLAANIWLSYTAFFKESPDKLPRLKLDSLGATSFVFSSTKEKGKITWLENKNILILGRSGEGYLAPHLTDTIMVLHINPTLKTPTAKIVSLPRDLLVKLKEPQQFLRINTLWAFAQQQEDEKIVKTVKEKIKEITSLDIDSILIFDLATVEKVVEKIDGLTVFVKEDIFDPRFPTKTGGYETFQLQHGWRYLGAEEVIKFIRTRHSPQGDFDRIGRQQEVLQALKGKLTSLNPIWDFPTLWSIFKTIRDGLITDLAVGDLKNLWLVSEQIPFKEIKTLSIETSAGLVKLKTIQLGGLPASVLVATKDDFDYTEIKERINEFILSY